MHPNISDLCGGADRCNCIDDRRAREFDAVDMHLGHLGAAHGDGDRVLARVARIRLQRGRIVVLCRRVVVPLACCLMMVLMRGWAVVVLGMIVLDVLVHVQKRPHGRRNDQGLHERAGDEATHGESLL